MEVGELRRVTTPSDWRACHDIRRAVLYEARGRFDYDENYPDNFVPAFHTLVFVVEGHIVGVARLDFHEDHAILRAVAVTPIRQREGLGRAMIERSEAYAAAQGANRLFVHSAADATGFYEKLGFTFAPPNEEPDNPRMTKGLTTP